MNNLSVETIRSFCYKEKMDTQLNELIKETAVIGACGKMGRGISLLLLQEMTLSALKSDPTDYHLKLIDPNANGFYELKIYLRSQLLRFAEKNINLLRQLYAEKSLVSNEEIINAFIEEGLRLIDCSTEIAHLHASTLIFEAALEDIPLKTKILKEVAHHAPTAWVLSNTSSIPIALLAKDSGLHQRLIGCHFYNPPPIQPLIELISSEETSTELEQLTYELAKRWNKTVIKSADVAGFIGNGHFVREMVFACELVEELSLTYRREEAVQIIDTITRDFLLRPMGIFELLDYVGLFVAKQILEIMRKLVPDKNIHAKLIEEWVAHGLKGGQDVEGRSKEGIFQYRHGKAVAIYNSTTHHYEELKALTFLGEIPLNLSWKQLQKDAEKNKRLTEYFDLLTKSDSIGAQLALRFINKSREIEKGLVAQSVAHSIEDVGVVLKKGFHQIYSPHEVLK